MAGQVYQLVPVTAGGGSGAPAFRMFEDYPDVMGTRDAARALDVSEAWLREAAARGEVRSFHAGRLLKFSKAALIEYTEGSAGDGRW